MKSRRYIICPQCGKKVKIPLFWILGVEGIFRCADCRLPFKTGYKMGAVLFALSLSLSIVTVQLLVYVFSIYSMPFFVLAIVPLWLLYAFYSRRWYMMWKIKRKIRNTQPK